jgi:MFS family permease
MDRFGIRRSVLCALAVLAAGVASTSLMREAWQLILLWGFLVGGATGFLATVLAATVATRWFTARRGLVVGLLSGGAATGQLLFLPVMAGIAANYGWRATVLTVATVALCVIPSSRSMRDRPSDMGRAGKTGKPAGRQGQLIRSPSARRRGGARADFGPAGTFFRGARPTADQHPPDPVPSTAASPKSRPQRPRHHRRVQLMARPDRLASDRFDNLKLFALLRAARALADLPAVLGLQPLRPVAVRGVLRARLVAPSR